MKPQMLFLSRIRRLGDRYPRRISFADYLKESAEMGSVIKKVRSGEAKKDDLPAIIPAGVFLNGHRMENLRRMNGMASFDIDACDAEKVKALLKTLPWVYFASLSASGAGVWGMVKFKSTAEYVFHYAALSKEFEKRGVTIDPTGVNINRLRFYSYDQDYYLNEASEVFAKKEIGVYNTKDGKNVDWKVEHKHQFSSSERIAANQFNRDHFCKDLFEAAGWTVGKANYRGQISIRRPGTMKSQSGNILKNRAWIFTSSTYFPNNSLNSPFDCFVFLFHEGNVRKALREIRINTTNNAIRSES